MSFKIPHSLRSILVLGCVALPSVFLSFPGWLLSEANSQTVERPNCRLSPMNVTRSQVPPDPDWAKFEGRGQIVRQSNLPRPGVTEQEVTSVAFSPDGKVLVSGSRYVSGKDSGGQIDLGVTGGNRDVNGGVELWSNLSSTAWNGSIIYQSQREITAVAFSPDGKFLAAGGNDKGFIGLWRQAQWSKLQNRSSLNPQARTNSQFQINAIAFSPNSQMLASGGIRGRGGRGHAIQRWSVREGMLRPLNSPMENVGAPSSKDLVEDQEVYAIAFSPDSKLIAGGGLSSFLQREGTVFKPLKAEPFLHLWNSVTGKYQCTIANLSSTSISAVAFSPDGRLLAAGNTNGMIYLWNLSSGDLLATLNQHQRRVNAIAFSPSGEILLSGSIDRSVKLWQVSTGQMIQSFSNPEGEITSVAFRPDGQAFAIGSKDNTIQLFAVQN